MQLLIEENIEYLESITGKNNLMKRNGRIISWKDDPLIRFKNIEIG